jgi:hypothetical protein
VKSGCCPAAGAGERHVQGAAVTGRGGPADEAASFSSVHQAGERGLLDTEALGQLSHPPGGRAPGRTAGIGHAPYVCKSPAPGGHRLASPPGRLLVPGTFQGWAGTASIQVITAPSTSHAAQIPISPQLTTAGLPIAGQFSGPPIAGHFAG